MNERIAMSYCIYVDRLFSELNIGLSQIEGKTKPLLETSAKFKQELKDIINGYEKPVVVEPCLPVETVDAILDSVGAAPEEVVVVEEVKPVVKAPVKRRRTNRVGV